MKYRVIDSEGDGLAYDCTKLHVIGWTDDGETWNTTHDYEEMRKVLSEDVMFVCHNSVRHDLPVFNRILGLDLTYLSFVDSLALSWYLHYDRNKHGLGSYGDDYGVPKPVIDDWHNLSPEIYADRVTEDCKINWRLWKDLDAKLNVLYPLEVDKLRFIKYLSFKMDCARVQEELGVYVDTDKAQGHLDLMTKERDDKYIELRKSMPKVSITAIRKYPAKPFKQDGSLSAHGIKWLSLMSEMKLPQDTKGEVTVVTGYEEPNPQSDVQIKDWLYSLGWEPRTFKFDRNKETGVEKQVPQIRYLKGHPKEGELCESILELADKDPAIHLLAGLSILKHRIGFFEGMIKNASPGPQATGATALSTGEQAFTLPRLTASIDGLTNTLRFQHRAPLANIPSVGKPYGKEIRSCLIAPPGKILCGADMVSLEDTTKRHYMQPLDPDYVAEMQQPGFDPHLSLALFAGAITQEQYTEHVEGIKSYNHIRKPFKVVNYSATYGIREAKLSRENAMTKKEAKVLLDAFWKRNWAIVKIAKDAEVKITGKSLWLKNPVSGFYHQLRYDKDRFSTLNQSTGVYCFDTWLYFVRQLGVDPVFQFHDEQGNYVDLGKEEENTVLLRKAIKMANDKLKLNVPLGIDVKYGSDYAETH